MQNTNLNTINNLQEGLETIDFLRARGALRNVVYCSLCNHALHQVRYKRNIDGYAFKCNRSSCSKFKVYVSIRKHSFFENLKIELKQILKLVYCWFKEESQVDVIQDYGVSKNTVNKVYKKLRALTVHYFEDNNYTLGGNGIICQIDESMFKYKQKYNVGRVSSEYRWVFGIADTSFNPSKYYVELVQNRSRETLMSIILSRIKPGSIIWSDEWRAYRTLGDNNFIHNTVNHRVNFVNPETGVHTQNIESLWNKLKIRIKKQYGISTDILNEYLNEWMWKDNVCKGNFNKVFELLNS